LILPLNCFQFPSMQFQSIANSFRFHAAATFRRRTVQLKTSSGGVGSTVVLA
jgi:hypothetical protein